MHLSPWYAAAAVVLGTLCDLIARAPTAGPTVPDIVGKSWRLCHLHLQHTAHPCMSPAIEPRTVSIFLEPRDTRPVSVMVRLLGQSNPQ